MIKNSAKNIVLIVLSLAFSLASLAISVYLYAYGPGIVSQRDVRFTVLTTVFSLLPPLVLVLYSAFLYYKRIAMGLVTLSTVFAAFYFAVFMIYDVFLTKKPNFDTITILRIAAFFLLMFITRQLMRFAFYVKAPLVWMNLLCFAVPVYSIIQSNVTGFKSVALSMDMSLALYFLSLLFFIIGFENRVPKTFDEDESDDEPELPISEEETEKTLDN